MARPNSAPPPAVPGLAARRIAADILDGVLRRSQPLDEQLDGAHAPRELATLADRDRALVRRLVATVLRRLGSLRHLVATYLDRGLPADAPRIETILLLGAVQVLWLDVPDHATVDLAVRLAQADRRGARYAGLVNAVLRRVAQDGAQRLAQRDTAALDTPSWLMARWTKTYGAKTAKAIALAHSHEPALDFTVKSNPEYWATHLRGRLLPTGTVRAHLPGAVSLMPGYREGEWWVQDAAAALPARLFGDVAGKRIGDLCAAPGGKTAQLAQAGAHVTAVDRSGPRLARLRENLARLQLTAETVAADILEWQPEPFDAVLLDAPCSSTGTIRRHPDVPWLKRDTDIAALVAVQRQLLARAAALVRPGGTLIYCTCSLEPEEGIDLITELLAIEPGLRRQPIAPAEVGNLPELVTPAGDLRTLPCHLPDSDPLFAGLDGFYAARLQRIEK
jgi:16S rRNA (cytosine967-C5)-methyltransferase